MIATLLIGLAATTMPDDNPGQIVSQMLSYYNDAETLAGTIVMTQRAAGREAIIRTELQVERPAKMFIRQLQRTNYDEAQWLVTSDGKAFSYDPPQNVPGKRLVESCNPQGRALTYREIYQASVASLGDRSTPLDIVIGRKEDLSYRRYQWATLTLLGKTQVGSEEVTVVGGNWREYGQAPVSATYEMYVDSQHRLLRYVEKTKVGTKVTGGGVVSYDVETTWDVSVVKNGPVRSELFKVIL